MSKYTAITLTVIIGLGVILATASMAAVKYFDLGYTGTGVVLDRTSAPDCYVNLQQEDGSVDRAFVYGTACYNIEVGDTISIKNDMLVR